MKCDNSKTFPKNVSTQFISNVYSPRIPKNINVHEFITVFEIVCNLNLFVSFYTMYSVWNVAEYTISLTHNPYDGTYAWCVGK